jgi:2-polyprenyl-3-methyl-5-hydroxy-6-metoxy-1,4-benzoquinol methylase
MTETLVAEQAQQRDTFLGRVLESVGGAFGMLTLYIGDQLGLYEALAEGGAQTASELAARTETRERYVREWLEQQTVTGVLVTENPNAGAAERRFHLPAGHAEVLTARDSLNYLAPLAQMVVGVSLPIHRVLHAMREGGGVPYSAYGADFREGQAGINRAMFLEELPHIWLAAVPGLQERLRADPPARVADIGCGAGWSSIGIARAYPKVRVDGYDLDAPSVEMARANAALTGLNGNLAFHVRDAGDPSLVGSYDLVLALEAIHDMSDPVSALRTMRKLAGRNGTVIVADERVSEQFTPEGNDVEWMMYGWSVLHCLPVGMADDPSAETGTVMRTGTLRRYAREAGFRAVEVLPVENFFMRIYCLVP